MFFYKLKIFILRIIGYDKPLRVALLKIFSLKYKQFRPHYETILLESCINAKKLGYEEVTVLELGVSGGNGIIALEKYKKKIEKYTNIKIKIIGFDSGAGMPEPKDVYDLPFYWKKGQMAVNKNKLELLSKSKIYYGDIKDTIDDFIKTNPKNIASIFVDLDYHSSTKSFLTQLTKLEKNLCPRVYFLFDDTFNSNHFINEYNGEILSINEFNNENSNLKIGISIDNVMDFKFPLAKNHLYLLHNFNHPDYNKYIGIDDSESLQIGDTKIRSKIF